MFITFPCILSVQVQAFNAKLIHYVLSGAKCRGHLVFGQSVSITVLPVTAVGGAGPLNLGASTEAYDGWCIATLSRDYEWSR